MHVVYYDVYYHCAKDQIENRTPKMIISRFKFILVVILTAVLFLKRRLLKILGGPRIFKVPQIFILMIVSECLEVSFPKVRSFFPSPIIKGVIAILTSQNRGFLKTSAHIRVNAAKFYHKSNQDRSIVIIFESKEII